MDENRIKSKPFRFRGVVAVGILFLTVPVLRADPPPRYQFRVGDWLVYERRAETVALDNSPARQRIMEQIQLWCLEKQGDEFLILLDLIRVVDGRAEPIRGLLLYVDEAGQCRLPPETQTRAPDLDSVFDVLPRLRPALEPGPAWRTPPDLYGRRWRCAPANPNDKSSNPLPFEFTIEDDTGAAEILGQTRAGRFWFDSTSGLLTRLEAREEDRSANTRTDITLVLRHRTQNEDRWCAQRVDESRRWLVALRGEDRLCGEILSQPAQAEQILERLDRLWAEFGRDIDRTAKSPFEPLGAARRRHLAATEAQILRARARLAERWTNRPAPPWSLQNPAGETISSESLRGGLVVECLWSAESPWGPRMLDTLRRLQTELAGKPVQIICLNVDTDPARAARAVQRCGLGLTQVLAWPLRSLEPALELPAVRILDRRRTIRAFVLGWRPSLSETLAPFLK